MIYNEVLCQAVQRDSKVLLKQKSHFVSGLILRISGIVFPLGIVAVILFMVVMSERIKR
ncbi:MAG: hypothetical protein Q8N66_09830 [Bacteroidota bacterium]|nr:hypothetical protein [Bacteroidota bacterium]